MNRAKLAHPAYVIAGQIDQHEVFSPFFFVGQKLSLELVILVGCTTPGPGSSDRPDFHQPVGQADMDLGRGAHQGKILGFEEEHVGGRIDRAQGPVQIQGPREVSLREWFEIIKAQQQIVVRPDGSYARSDFNLEEDAKLEWVQWNKERDQMP